MSLMNGLFGLGQRLAAPPSADMLAIARDADDQEFDRPAPKPSLLNGLPPADDAPPPAPAAAGGADANPYGNNPHAAALLAAEKAIIKPESGGKADAQNPVSSAGGLYQIIDGTWDAAIKKMGLPVAATQAERNAQKYDPALNTQVMRQINAEAANTLDAQGLPVTAQTLQAAHRLGPAGAALAIKAAMADPNAPLVGNGLSPEAVRGNGDVAGLTVGQFLLRPYGNRSV